MSMVSELMERGHPDQANIDFTWDRFREAAQRVAAERGEWAGAPMLADEVPLTLEPRYPYAFNGKCLNNLVECHTAPEPDEEYTLANSWWCEKRAATVYVLHHKVTGKQEWFWAMDNGWPHRWTTMLDAMDPARYMDVHAESRALRTLQGMVSENAFRHYFLLGYFLETSPRSRLTYMFRKLRPTIVMTPRKAGPDGRIAESHMRLLTCLCLHPIGYYEGTHLGTMVPTDDVLAHLLMMRGDEHTFWRKANHHPPHSWQAGI